MLGLGHPITGPFPITSWAYNTAVPVIPYDTVKAKALLAQVGWKPGANGILQKNGKPFAFTLMTNQGNKIRALAAEVIQRQLQAIGIDVKIRIVEWSTFIHENLDKKNFEAIVMGWQLGRDPDAYGIWHSSQQKEGQYNFCGYSSATVDRLLDAGRREFNTEKRKKIYHEMHAQIAADLPYIFLYSPDSLSTIHKRFRGPEVGPIGLGWNFIEWFVPKAEQKYRTVITP